MKQHVEIRPGRRLAYEDDCFVPPWQTPEPMLLIHGIAESTRAWTGWVPHLAAEYRVLRFDLPGLGDSPAPAGYDWSLQQVVADAVAFLDALGIRQVHLVAAKFGGCVAMQLAADHPERVRSLALFGAPFRGRNEITDLYAESDRIKKIGVHAWADSSQRKRLGSEASDAQVRWWSDELMGKAGATACAGYAATAGTTELAEAVARIQAPTLIVTTTDSPLQPVALAESYTKQMPDARLIVLSGDMYHVAATRPDACAGLLLEFLHGMQSKRG